MTWIELKTAVPWKLCRCEQLGGYGYKEVGYDDPIALVLYGSYSLVRTTGGLWLMKRLVTLTPSRWICTEHILRFEPLGGCDYEAVVYADPIALDLYGAYSRV
jgi:hypothetical protein